MAKSEPKKARSLSFRTRLLRAVALLSGSLIGETDKATLDRRLRRGTKQRLAAHIAERAPHDRQVVSSFDPRLIEAFAELEAASHTRTREVIHRAADIIEWLSNVRPTSIHELGSGRSSLVFSLWAKRHGIPYVAFEQSTYWVSIVSAAIDSLGGAGKIVHIGTRRVDELSNRFVADIPDDADFIYLDGPIGTINLDVADHLARGCRPATILVDGRTRTCEHLASIPAASDYEVQFQFKALPQYLDRSEIRRHTSFVLRSA